MWLKLDREKLFELKSVKSWIRVVENWYTRVCDMATIYRDITGIYNIPF